jgi:hypothetical protein
MGNLARVAQYVAHGRQTQADTLYLRRRIVIACRAFDAIDQGACRVKLNEQIVQGVINGDSARLGV